MPTPANGQAYSALVPAGRCRPTGENLIWRPLYVTRAPSYCCNKIDADTTISARHLKHHPDKQGWFGDYGGAGLHQTVHVHYATVADRQAPDAFTGCRAMRGSSRRWRARTRWRTMPVAPEHPGETVLVKLSGRADKGIDVVADTCGCGG